MKDSFQLVQTLMALSLVGEGENINPTISPSGVSSGSNTTGGGGNPVASNPVTSTGGGKKNN